MIRLRQTKGADSGRELEFDQALVRIGRMPDSDVNFDPEVDLDASGRHAEIRGEDGRYMLIDAGSRNGTWVNGRRVRHAAIEQGDEIELGRGGPKLKVVAIGDGPAHRKVKRTPTGAVRRDPRFDPLAASATAVTLDPGPLDEPSSPMALSARGPSVARSRWRPKTAVLWAAAGMVLFVALVLIVSASVQ